MRKRCFWLLPPLAAAAWLIAQNAAPPPSPLLNFPPGAMLALEARDLGQLVREWNTSQLKRDWLSSDAFRQFAVSRLGQRLQDAQRDFSAATGAPVDMTLAGQLAGGQAALALYDPGELEFLLVTRLTEARFAASLLGRRRAALSPRNAGGTAYYVAANPGSSRTVVFSLRGEWLIVGTTEALVSQLLQRLAAGSNNGLPAEPWYARAAQAGGAAGELRMAADLDALYRSPHFRSYWVHRNRAELQPFVASISDLDRTASAWTERRVLVRKEAAVPAAVDASAWPVLLKSVPPAAGLFRGWLRPDPAFAAALIVQKLFDPAPGAATGGTIAPSISASDEAGAENAWEYNIDEAPFVPGDSRPDGTGLARWLGAAGLTGLLHVQGTQDSPDAVWIRQDTGIVLTRTGSWNPAEWEAESRHLASGSPIASAIDGERLLLASSPRFLAAMRADANLGPPPPGTRFLGVFRHEGERTRFRRWLTQIDRPTYIPPAQGETREPALLGDVIGSLSEALRSVTEVTVATADTGDRLHQTIIYKRQ